MVIDIMEADIFAQKMRRRLRGKSIRFVLTDVVCREAKKARGFDVRSISARIRRLLGREVDVISIEERHIAEAERLSSRYHMCHHGDNRILAFCRERGLPLVTRDGDLHRVSQWVGVASFRPSEVGGI